MDTPLMRNLGLHNLMDTLIIALLLVIIELLLYIIALLSVIIELLLVIIGLLSVIIALLLNTSARVLSFSIQHLNPD